MQAMPSDRDRYRYEEEDEEETLPFEGLEKTSALQQCRVFNDVRLDISSCLRSMTQCLYLLCTGTTLTETEATDLFFMSTKLLQSTHPKLRRLHYVLMKELSPLVEQRFIASNSLMIDIKSNNDASKCNGIRTLFKVMNSSLYASMDRTIVEALTSQSSNVVCAALVTGLHIAQVNPEMARKWGTQLTEVIRSCGKAQYAAIALLHKMRKNDRLSVTRLIDQAKNGVIRSPMALCLVIKMCTELMREDFEGSLDIYKFVTSMMHNNNDLVVFESVKSICSLRNITAKEVSPAVMVVQLYLNTQSAVLRFSAIRVLNEVATLHPAAVSPINSEIENLVTDPNRIIATLAITTLLKTGTEYTIERLITQLSTAGYLRELGDEFKMVIIDAMRVLSAKFPAKYNVFLGFLSKLLAEEGSSQLKENVVDVTMEIAKSNPDSKESVLKHLAEFIDDCNYSQIVRRVLMYLGEEVPLTENPKMFVRYVYNHATLEGPEIRAVAVSTLAKLAAYVPSLRRSIVVLLKRTCNDADDEVRDRAVLYTRIFLNNDENTIRSMVCDVANTVAMSRQARIAARSAVLNTVAEDIGRQKAIAKEAESGTEETSAVSHAVLQGREKMRKIKQLLELGEPIVSSEPVPLTDPDSEYVVTVMKHTYISNIVLQFKVKNTMEKVTFKNIAIELDTDEVGVEPQYFIPIESVAPASTSYGYAVLRYEEEQYPSGTLECRFKFAMQEEGGDVEEEEEYPLEGFDINVSDFIAPVNLGGTFETQWEKMQLEETTGTYSLSSMRNLTVAARELVEFFGMYVEGGSPGKITTASHTLQMSGTMVNRARSLVLITARVFIAKDKSVALQLMLRGATAELREYLSAALLA
ncbi:coatomer gamma subunit [Trypanosoma cruzi Dm28c]|uniref:Coatomer subunit gamma n=2 Tax=Trypanosoma cruzi TaxID=5693 RepID=V5DCV8_TRYCR|nr:coatomer gamma subunit [Trypanosoma cruzi Dm28c]KAF8283010.1 Coatomer subunit gamma [Trypanosoma cruzi]PBJ72359.1 coatomer gamma subunit [Trypanosoma cruzi cruzi]PWU85964.1 Coatomer subunit gamma [Trypanosoma cruzi]PWV00815.1 Coatomer subunit gamma [Trypanosoma cruzi]